MRLLFLAPQPFFQERGTPIAVRLALEVLAARKDNELGIDLLTYHEGTDIEIEGVTIHRIKAPAWLSGIGAGISVKKLLCDVIFLKDALRMAFTKKYRLVHAVEESVFIAWLIKKLLSVPYIYDMDSSLALQLTEKWWLLRCLRPILSFCEKLAVRQSIAVVPVCDTLAEVARRHGASDLGIVRDISLLKDDAPVPQKGIREELNLQGKTVVLYVGNLERYQGIDLLVDSFNLIGAGIPDVHVVCIGGSEAHQKLYRERVSPLVKDQVHFVGPRPVQFLRSYLMEADILVSPRTMGNNTPMKVFSYLHAGKALLATRIESHTQILDNEISLLADPTPRAYGEALKRLCIDRQLREKLGAAGYERAEKLYTFPIFQRDLNAIYDRALGKIGS